MKFIFNLVLLCVFVRIGNTSDNENSLKSIKYARQIELPFLNWLFGDPVRPVRNATPNIEKINNRTTNTTEKPQYEIFGIPEKNISTNSTLIQNALKQNTSRQLVQDTQQQRSKQPSNYIAKTLSNSSDSNGSNGFGRAEQRSARFMPGFFNPYDAPLIYPQQYYQLQPTRYNRRRQNRRNSAELRRANNRRRSHTNKKEVDLETSASKSSSPSSPHTLMKRQALISMTPQQQLYLQALRQQQQQLLALNSLGNIGLGNNPYGNYAFSTIRRRRRPSSYYDSKKKETEKEKEDEDDNSDYYDNDNDNDYYDDEDNGHDDQVDDNESDDFESDEFMSNPFRSGVIPSNIMAMTGFQG